MTDVVVTARRKITISHADRVIFPVPHVRGRPLALHSFPHGAPYAMTTGSRGLHVVTPLRRTAEDDEVHDFARAVAAVLVAHDPGTLTTEFRRDRRGNRIFVDVGRNGYGQRAVAPYAVRALPKAPVATPLRRPEGWKRSSCRPRARA